MPGRTRSSRTWSACVWDAARIRQGPVRFNDLDALFAIPNVHSVSGSRAKDMHSAVAAIAVHGFVGIVDGAAYQTWLFLLEQRVVYDQGRIDVGLLLFVLYSVR